METEILKLICANQGAVDAEDLRCNLFPGESTNEVVSNPNKFALCFSNGQQKVVARTSLKLCRKKDCPGGPCRGLHLCKNFLFSGSCQFLLSRRGCSFSHDLNSDHNQKLLIEHELEGLSRAELCTLLLQSDHTLLPSICHDYNNGEGVFGRCASGIDCDRLHICEKFLTQSCSCSRAHDFFAFQPKKTLDVKMVPDNIKQSLKPVYANREALRISSRGGASRGRRGSHSSNDGPHLGQRRGYRGRGGNRGNRGPRGGRGTRGNFRQPTNSDTPGDFDGWDLCTEDGSNDNGGLDRYFNLSSSDISADGYDIDAKSDSGLIEQRQWIRGRGGNRGFRGPRGPRGNRGGRETGGNQLQHLRSTSFSDIWGEFDGLNLGFERGPSRSESHQGDPNSSNSDDTDTSGNGRSRRHRSKNRSKDRRRASADKGRGGNQQGLLGAAAIDHSWAAAGREEGNGGDEQKRRQRNKPVKDKTEICMYFIKGYCKHDDKCFKAHDKMPYRWQVQEGDQWNVLPDNETIEKEYSDPSNTYSGNPPVHFDTMTRGEKKVRRLTTVNSLIEPNFIHTTEWLWYWQDEFGKWNRYGSDSTGRKSSDINSATLEQKFLDNENDVVEFSAGSQSYSLSFQDMIQTNKHYSTKRLVSRRPQFVSAADVRTKKVRRPPANSPPVPDNWDKTQIPLTGFSRVAVRRTSDEFQRLEALFCTTLRGFNIVKIERIQNKALWEVFQWQKTQMKNNNNGCEVEEKQLFHGTDSKHVDAICLNNFDWRICGVNGTAFGKGSYFARDAKYSHSYTGDSDVKTMFITRVLVGSYTKGQSSYLRPPPKDGGDINFYDSCVDNIANPSIFVVFEKHQIYPEYLLEYKATQPAVSKPTTSMSVQQPKPAPRLKQPVYQPSTVSYQPSPSFNQPSSSYFQPSSSSYQSSSSSYQSSTASYRPSSSSNLSRTTSSLYQTRPVHQPTYSSSSSSSKPDPKTSCVIS